VALCSVPKTRCSDVITGLLIARGDTILVERYQYARNDRHRFTSQSMAKTVTSVLVGIAIAEGVPRQNLIRRASG
jgi:CubicO group peptidase (beta-lactamase class C family)